MPSPVRWLPSRDLVGVCFAAAAASCSPATPVDGAERPWLTEITDEVGLDYLHEPGARGEYAMPEIMGAGVALFDAEEDGDLDIYCANGSGRLPSVEREATPWSRFYRQEGGRFVDATDAAGLGDGRYAMGPAVADADNDGDSDVYVTHYGPNTLYLNDGRAHFADDTAAAGLDGGGWSSASAFFDFDRDGDLDLFVARYVDFDPTKACFDNAGQRDYCGPKAFPPVSDLLFRNEGGASFTDISHAAGVDALAAAGLGVVCGDLDDDGWQDVFVANDAYPNHLWINQRDGTVREQAMLRGAALNLNGQPQAGMGIAMADFDGDRRPDLFITHLREEASILYLNQGAAGFRDATGASGLGPPSMRFTGFGTAALDFDRDTDLDLLVLQGAVFHRPPVPGVELSPPWDSYAEPNHFFVNQGQARFEQHDELAGPLCSRIEVSRSLSAGDVDGDGDPDLLVGNVAGRARLYRNDSPEERHWIGIRCRHPRWRRDALGARVTITAGDRVQAQILSSSWSYLSSSPPYAYFGLGEATAVERVDVRWPDGVDEAFLAPAVDRVHVLVRGTGGE